MWTGKVDFPPISKSIFFDIETDVYDGRIWMIGSLIDNQYYQFTAKNWDEEKEILIKFADLLNEHRGFPLICYSRTNFDFRYIVTRATELHLEELLDAMSKRAWIDLATILKRHYSPPHKSMGLKVIGEYLQFPFSHKGMDGFEISVRYANTVRKYGSITDDFLKIAEEYNKDDLDLMTYIISNFNDKFNFESYYVRNENIDSLCQTISQYIIDRNIGSHRIRFSCSKDDVLSLQISLMKLGLPLPQILYGKSRCSIVYTSRLALLTLHSILEKYTF